VIALRQERLLTGFKKMTARRTIVAGYSAVLFPLISTLALAATRGNELKLRQVLDAHKSSRAQLYSAHARIITTVRVYGISQSEGAEWWHDGDRYRVRLVHWSDGVAKEKTDKTEREYGLYRGQPCALTFPKTKRETATAILNTDQSLSTSGSLWSAGMCWVNNRFGWYFEDEFRGARGMTNVSSSKVGEKVRVTGQLSDCWYDVDFDPSRNYVITRVAERLALPDKPEKLGYLAEAKTISEVAPGVFFPTLVHIDLPTMKGFQDTRIEFLSVNQPIAEEDLAIHPPANTSVIDGATREVYHVDKDGEVIGKVSSLPPEVQPRTVRGVDQVLEGQQGALRSWRTFAAGTLLLGIVCASLFLFRSMRKS
jgi:hypothetical protein